MMHRLAAAALIPITLAASTALTSCSAKDGATDNSNGQANKQRKPKSPPVSFNFTSEDGFRYQFTGTSAFYSATGDPNDPMATALPPGLTYIVVYGKLGNLMRDRPAPSPARGLINRFAGITVPAQKKIIHGTMQVAKISVFKLAHGPKAGGCPSRTE